MLRRTLFLAVSVIALAACEKDDIGRACPDRDPAPSGASNDVNDDNEIDVPATVRRDSQCETFVCLSTQTRSDYCSRECRGNSNCPDGFVCQNLQPVGPLKDIKYCVLGKTCRNNNDCPKDRMVCKEVATSVPDQPANFCDLK
jgi:hypothetical protein